MALLNPPSFMQARTDHTAQQDRLNLGGIMWPGLGKLTTPLVRQQGTPALSVLVGCERFYIAGTQNTHQGVYHCYNDADVTVSSGAAAGHATLVRIDMLVAEVRDSAYSGANNDWQFRIVPGTAGSGVKPALPVNAVEVATITMPAAANTILNAYISNSGFAASAVGGIFPVATPTAAGTAVVPEDTIMYSQSDKTLRRRTAAGQELARAGLPSIANTSAWGGTGLSVYGGQPLRIIAGQDAAYVTNASSYAAVPFGETVSGIKAILVNGWQTGPFDVSAHVSAAYSTGFDCQCFNAGVLVGATSVALEWLAVVW